MCQQGLAHTLALFHSLTLPHALFHAPSSALAPSLTSPPSLAPSPSSPSLTFIPHLFTHGQVPDWRLSATSCTQGGRWLRRQERRQAGQQQH